MANLSGHNLVPDMCVSDHGDRWGTFLLGGPACPDQLSEGL